MTDLAASFRLDGKVAVVTGGSRGLGREMVRAFASAGADVVIVSRNLESCQLLANEIVETTGRRALPYACHVGRWDDLDQLADDAYAEFGHVDILVNNAGMSPTYNHVLDISEALYDKVLDVNLKGPFRLTALIGTRMAEASGGSIINVSSMSSIRAGEDVIPYAAAKAGINNMTLSFAYAFGPTVRVNCLMVGPFLTDVSKHWDLESFNLRAQHHALRRGGNPPEVAGAAVYFASDASSFTTGAILRIDGGMRS